MTGFLVFAIFAILFFLIKHDSSKPVVDTKAIKQSIKFRFFNRGNLKIEISTALRNRIVFRFNHSTDQVYTIALGLIVPLLSFAYHQSFSVSKYLYPSKVAEIENEINSDLMLTKIAPIYYYQLFEYAITNNLHEGVIKAIEYSQELFYLEVKRFWGRTNSQGDFEDVKYLIEEKTLSMANKYTLAIDDNLNYNLSDTTSKLLRDDIYTNVRHWLAQHCNNAFDCLDYLNKIFNE